MWAWLKNSYRLTPEIKYYRMELISETYFMGSAEI